MRESIYKDYIPANARVLVDYKSNERVRFSYPREWTYWKAVNENVRPFFGHMGFSISLWLFLIWLFINMFFLFDVTTDVVTKSQIITLKHPAFTFFSLAGIFLFFYISNFIAYLFALNKEFLSKWYPILAFYYNKLFMFGTKEKIFKPKDVFNNKVIIPHFENMLLNYKCKGNFRKYLEKVQILELPFEYKKGFSKFKKQKNDYEFIAIFYFSQKPKTGSMEVEFI